jgi:protein SCO1/2
MTASDSFNAVQFLKSAMRTFIQSLVGSLALAIAGTAAATTPGASVANAADPDAHHHHMMPEITRSTVDYTLPQVSLVRQDGKTVVLSDELNDGRPVMLNFIYTTCTSICPVISQTFSQLQSELGSERDKVHLVSVSIDPEHDTPARLREYAKQYQAGPSWQHYTGTVAASIATQRAFDVYRGDKMSHSPVTLFRPAPGKPWVRIEGFVTASELLSTYHDSTRSQ